MHAVITELKSWLAAIVVLSVAACAPPVVDDEEQGSTTSALDGRFNPDHPDPVQNDQWSCSVHTTTWMLQSTRNDETWSSVSRKMLNTGRVTYESGLSDASGAGLAQTLREMATGDPSIGSTGSASFDEVKDRAGRMAVGIGGRAWNHWSAVKGYDAQQDVLLLANSAPKWNGVGTSMDRDEFRRMGGISMVWMDYGGGASAPATPFEPAVRPASDPFPALHIRTDVAASGYVTQCNREASAERVWQTNGSGPDPETRWAPPSYAQQALKGCGKAGPDGVYPLVLRSVKAGERGGAWIVQCTGSGEGVQHVFRVDAVVDGHPAASFLYNEPNTDCD